ncbi:hypothetical protein RV02_GL001728 [Enterococcus gilvus]|nr:hypothetical protein RV02_GL001728 [Enterococcus gilvus]
MFAGQARSYNNDFKDYFSKYYDVSTNYTRDEYTVDYLVVPKSFPTFHNENNLRIIEVPANLLMKKEFKKIKDYIDDYFSDHCY